MNLNQIKDGKIFAVKFIKRTNGEIRIMVARTGVTSFLSGRGRKFKDSDHNLLTVFDMQKQGYRCIPLESILELNHHGKREINN